MTEHLPAFALDQLGKILGAAALSYARAWCIKAVPAACAARIRSTGNSGSGMCAAMLRAVRRSSR